MADDAFKTHVLDGPSEGDGPQTQVPEDNPLIHGPAHKYDPHNEPTPNEVLAAEAEEAEKAKAKPKAKPASKTTKTDTKEKN